MNLYRHRGLGKEPTLIRGILQEKCQSKEIGVPTAASILESSTFGELDSEWENMLANQLPVLPPIQVYLDEMENLFLWLEGRLELEELPPATIPGDAGEPWRPPPLVSTWDAAPMESIRFAAANLLLVELEYEGRRRMLKPYSLQRIRDGHILLFAQDPGGTNIKSFRIDRIEAVAFQKIPFQPRYTVEFSSEAAITSRPVRGRIGQ